MKFLLEHLRTYTDLPERAHATRELLDDVGIEVKTSETSSLGTVFNVELLANRGDHYCYEGVARELRGRTGGALRYPPVRKLDAQPAPPDRVRIESPLCFVYTLTELFAPGVIPSAVEGPGGAGGSFSAPSVRPGPSTDARDDRTLPTEVLAPMIAADIHSTLAPVDASNLTNLDLGQPTHAFDGDTIDGAIVIRTSRKGEKAWMLFTDGPVEIPEGTLVIADSSKILGIAGVIGCVESAVTDKTKRIWLEAATFDPVAIRIASRQLNQPTDAAARFMRGGDLTLPLVGAGRVAYLLEKYCGYTVGDAFITGDWKNPFRTIDVDVARTQKFIGAPLSHLEMAERLTRYGFTVEPEVNKLTVTVPPGRLWDVHFEADLQEELLKSVGYNNTMISLPAVDMGALPSHEENVITRTNDVLVSEGFYEIFTDSFYARRVIELLDFDPDDHVAMVNSIEKDYSFLRNNTVGQALLALQTNVHQKNANVKMFEWARVYVRDAKAENGLNQEQSLLWLLANGRDRGPFWGDKGRAADSIYLKGIVEQLRLELRVDFRIGSSNGHRLEHFFHPGRRAGIHIGGKLAGIFGELHPTLVQKFGIKRQRPVYLEIEIEALMMPPLERAYTEPPARQPVIRNVAYAVPSGVSAAEVSEALKSAAPPFLREIRVVDLFDMPEQRARAITFEIEYLSDEALTGETINAATEAMMAAVASRFGDRVTLRA